MTSYRAFDVFPVTAGATSPIRYTPQAENGGSARVTLTGAAFSARVQISNDRATGGASPIFNPTGGTQTVTDALFVPDIASWVTIGTLTQNDLPLTLFSPLRYVRILLDSGTVLGGEIQEDETRGPPADARTLALATQAGTVAGNAAAAPAQGTAAAAQATASAAQAAATAAQTTAGTAQTGVNLVTSRLGVVRVAGLAALDASIQTATVDGLNYVRDDAAPVDNARVYAGATGTRWRLIGGVVDLWWVSSGTNITPILAALFASQAPIRVNLPGRALILNGNLDMYIGQYLIGAGCSLTYLNHTGANEFAIRVNRNTASGISRGGEISALTINGPGALQPQKGINLTDNTHHFEIHHNEFANLNVDIRYGTSISTVNFFNDIYSNNFASSYIGIQFNGAANANRHSNNTYQNCTYGVDFGVPGNVSEHNSFEKENFEGCNNWANFSGVPATTFTQFWTDLRIENPTTNLYVCEFKDPGRQVFIGMNIVPAEGSNPLANDPTPANRRGVRTTYLATPSTRLGTKGSSYPDNYGAYLDEDLQLSGYVGSGAMYRIGPVGWLWADSATGRPRVHVGSRPNSNSNGFPMGYSRIGGAAVALTQTAIPHGFGVVPSHVLIVAKGNYNVWESQAADATNVFLTSSAAGSADLYLG